MQANSIRKCSLCLVHEKEAIPFLQELKKAHPEVHMELVSDVGRIEFVFQGKGELDFLVDRVKNRFPTFFYGEGSIAQALHREMIFRKKSLALAESCTGGAIAVELTAIPDASKFFLGSLVVYSTSWKERFLHVSRTTLKQRGAVSKETVTEMAQGLLSETDADYVAAVSGIAGPGGGTAEIPLGTVYIAIGQRGGKIDAGRVQAPPVRERVIGLATQLTLGALWRRLVHNAATFS